MRAYIIITAGLFIRTAGRGKKKQKRKNVNSRRGSAAFVLRTRKMFEITQTERTTLVMINIIVIVIIVIIMKKKKTVRMANVRRLYLYTATGR